MFIHSEILAAFRQAEIFNARVGDIGLGMTAIRNAPILSAEDGALPLAFSWPVVAPPTRGRRRRRMLTTVRVLFTSAESPRKTLPATLASLDRLNNPGNNSLQWE